MLKILLRKEAAAALKKKQDAHNKAINDWDAAFEERQRFLDAGIGDEFKDWERDLKGMIEEQSKLDALSDEFDEKGEDIAQMGKNMNHGYLHSRKQQGVASLVRISSQGFIK